MTVRHSRVASTRIVRTFSLLSRPVYVLRFVQPTTRCMARTDNSDDADLQPKKGHNGTTTYTGMQTALRDFLNRETDHEEDGGDE